MNGKAHVGVGTIDSHCLDLLCAGFLAQCLQHRYFFVEPADLFGAIGAASDHQFAFGSCVAQLAVL
jgi:glucose-6-phosphate dehydrogenase assembly protein OpcA